MSGEQTFSAEWLTLREPADLAARSTVLVEELARVWSHAIVEGERLQVLDLATGTGANIRALAPRLRRPQDWLAVDLDARLLGELSVRTREWAAGQHWKGSVRDGRTLVHGSELDLAVTTARFDLRELHDVQSAGAVPHGPVSPFDGRALVTASALLDLLSEPQVLALARLCRQAAATVLFALTYDGRISLAPPEPEDKAVRALVNGHQRTDKGCGTALGPEATARAARALTDAGYHVRVEPSDWALGPELAELQRQLLAGWAHAAREMAPEQSATITDWLARRLAHVDAGRSMLAVGHGDLLATLATTIE